MADVAPVWQRVGAGGVHAQEGRRGTLSPGGTTQNQFRVDVVKRIGPDVEVNGWYQHERWVAPIYMPGVQSDNAVTVQVTFFPKLRTKAP